MQNQKQLFGRNEYNEFCNICMVIKKILEKSFQVKIKSTNQNSLFGELKIKKI